MQQDLKLKEKQTAWETPRNIAIIAGATAAISAAIAGWVGYSVGRQAPAQTITLAPGTIITTPAAPQPTSRP